MVTKMTDEEKRVERIFNTIKDEIKSSELVSVADEMSRVMFPNDTPIDTGQDTDSLLKEVISEASDIREDDEFSEGVVEFFIKHRMHPFPTFTKDQVEVISETGVELIEDALVDEVVEPEVKETDPSTKAKKAAPTNAKYTRSQAFVDSLTTIPKIRIELVTSSNQLVIDNGGSDNMKTSDTVFNFAMPILVLLGTVKKEGKLYSLVGKG